MFKILIISMLNIFAGYSLVASDLDFHKPEFKEDVRKMFDEQLKVNEQNFAEGLANSAALGSALPWVNGFAVGMMSIRSMSSRNDADFINGSIIGGLISSIVLSPISLLLTIPSTLGFMGYSSIAYLINGVKARKQEPTCEKEMLGHLVQWIEIVKRGRLAIRAELKTLEAEARIRNELFSISDAASDYLRTDTFDKYFSSLDWQSEDLKRMLNHLDKDQNTWENLFHTLSERMKIKELGDNQWQMLAEKLHNHVREESKLAIIGQDDIDEYLHCAIYFFCVAGSKHLKMLKYLLGP